MTFDRPAAFARLDAWFAAWNAHDSAALRAVFAPEGTYTDPAAGAPVPAADLARVVEPLWAAFPDLRLEPAPPLGGDGSRFAVEWVMRGRNTGAFAPGIEPTLREIALDGVTVFELGAEGVLAARGYFDQKTLAERLGLMALVQPVEQGAARYGYSMRVPSGNGRPPGVIALTWIQGADEAEKERIRAHSRQNVRDFLAEPGFISIVTGFTGLRGFTVTAWEDEASMQRALSKHHAVAMRELFGERFVSAVWTSVWVPARVNRLWVRCPACGSLEDVLDSHRECRQCQAPLPERPAFW